MANAMVTAVRATLRVLVTHVTVITCVSNIQVVLVTMNVMVIHRVAVTT
jgi:hypothetical protein